MEPDNQGGSIVAEPTAATEPAQPSAQPTAGDSGDWLDRGPSEETATFRDFLREGRQSVDLSSKPAEAAPDGESAPSGDVKPSESERGADGKFLPRRAVPKVINDLETENATLKAQLAERDPAKLREQWEAEDRQRSENAELARIAQTRAADVERYRKLREEPDASLSAEDYAWREDFKEKLKAIPEVEQLHQEYARQEIEATRAELGQRQNAFWSDVRSQMDTLASKPGVDAAAFAKLGRFDQMGDALYEAGRVTGRAELAEENRKLREENGQLKLSGPRGIASARSPLSGGEPSGAAPVANESALFRDFLRAGRAD